MKTRCLLFSVACVAALTIPWAAHAAPFAYISNSFDQSVSVIDTESNRVVATVEVGHSPYGVAVAPGGARVYITNRDDGTVSVLDGASHQIAATVAVGSSPSGVAVNSAGTRAYVANMEDHGTVSVIDTATNTVVSTIAVGRRPIGVAADLSSPRIYVGNTYDDRERRPCSTTILLFCDITVSVIDSDSNQAINAFPVGDHLAGLAISPDGQRLYVANQFPAAGGARGGISVVDGTFVGTKIPMGLAAPLGVAVHPTEARVYAALGSAIHVVDTTLNTVVTTIPVGPGAAGLSLTATGERLYVANTNGGTVSVIDTEANLVIATVAVGEGPVAFGQFIEPPIVPPSATPSTTSTPTDSATPNTTSTRDAPTSTPTLTPREVCTGDCDANHTVTVNELVMAVNITLERVPLTACRAGDSDGNGALTITELLQSVRSSLDGCP